MLSVAMNISISLTLIVFLQNFICPFCFLLTMLVFRQALFEGVKISFEPLTSLSSTNNQHSEFPTSDARIISLVLQKVIKKLEDVKQLRKTWER